MQIPPLFIQPIRPLPRAGTRFGRVPWFEVLVRPSDDTPDAFIRRHYLAGSSFAIDIGIISSALPRFRAEHHYSLNVSVMALADRNFLPNFLDLLHRHQVLPKYVVLELVGRDLADSSAWRSAFTTIHYLVDVAGVTMAIDDIGPDETWASYDLFRYVKLDVSMTRLLLQGRQTDSMTELFRARSNSLEIVCEGIETSIAMSQLEKLVDVAYWQGFYAEGEPAPFRPNAEQPQRQMPTPLVAASR